MTARTRATDRFPLPRHHANYPTGPGVGAMVGRAAKGLFITTGRFTKDAEREAVRDGAPAIDLIDGIHLCNVLKSLGLGVGTTTVVKAKAGILRGPLRRTPIELESDSGSRPGPCAAPPAKSQARVPRGLPTPTNSHLVQPRLTKSREFSGRPTRGNGRIEGTRPVRSGLPPPPSSPANLDRKETRAGFPYRFRGFRRVRRNARRAERAEPASLSIPVSSLDFRGERLRRESPRIEGRWRATVAHEVAHVLPTSSARRCVSAWPTRTSTTTIFGRGSRPPSSASP